MIQYRCACGRMLQADDDQSGLQARCPSCQTVSTIPGREASIQDEPPRRSDDRVDERRPLRRRSRDDGGESGGKMPVLLIVLGVLMLGFLLCGGLAVGLLLPAVGKVREAAKRMQESNNFKQLALAMHNVHDTYGMMPRPAIESPDGKPLLSWRVAILPYIEQDNLYRQFRLDEPWDSAHNKALIPMMPKIYMRPGDPPTTDGLTHYQMVVGKGLMFDYKYRNKEGKLAGRKLVDITDGTSNTIMFVVAQKAVTWTKPEDIDADDGLPIGPRLDTRFNGTTAAMGDGSVRLTPRTVNEATLRAALTADGGEVLGPDW